MCEHNQNLTPETCSMCIDKKNSEERGVVKSAFEELREEAAETKSCKEPDCVVGEPQPIEQFGFHPRWKTRMGVCKSCMDNKRSARQQKRKAKPKAPDTPAQENPPVTNSNLTIDFSNHTGLLAELKELAKKQLRTVENQALWMLAAIQKHGEKLEK